MCHMVPICHFLADLQVFSYILCLIILICVELKFITHARIELNITHAQCYLYFTLLLLYILAVVKVRIVVGWWRWRS